MDIYQTRNMNDDAVTGVLLVYSICCFYYIIFVCFIYLFRFLDQFIVFQFSSATSIRLQILGLSIRNRYMYKIPEYINASNDY